MLAEADESEVCQNNTRLVVGVFLDEDVFQLYVSMYELMHVEILECYKKATDVLCAILLADFSIGDHVVKKVAVGE
jgi:hypothetical protein